MNESQTHPTGELSANKPSGMMKMQHDDKHPMTHDMNDPGMAASMEADIRKRFWVALVLSLLVVLLSPMAVMVGIRIPINPHPRSWILFALTTPVVFWCGWIFIAGAYQSIKTRKLDMSVLISVGVLAAYFASLYLTVIGSTELFYDAAAMLVTFVLFGHWMEMKSRRGTNDSLKALFNLVPPKTHVIRNGQETEVDTADVILGDEVVIRPGDRVPVDGTVEKGESAIDEALVTGESVPVQKKPGDKVIGGSVNGSGTITFKVTAVGADATLNRIAKLVETAQNSKAPGQRLADKAAGYLVVLAVGAGIFTFIGWRWIEGVTFLTALTFAISAIVIACPDALGLATPTAVAVGTGLGAKHHILIKDAATLESTSRINAIVLDKTGTLTEGKPRVTEIKCVDGATDDNTIRTLAAVESQSSHPLAYAIMEESKRRNLKLPEDVKEFQNVAGKGVSAKVEGHAVLVGNEALMQTENVDMHPLQDALDRMLSTNQTILLLAVDKKAVAVVSVTDPIKSTAKRAIEELKKRGIETAMLSGDNQTVAEHVGKEVGIDRVFAEVLPENKAKFVQKLQSEGKFVAMVGDGVNDAPALAQSDIGIAIGAGTDVATEAADIVLMQSEPIDIVNAIILSKATVGKMKQNLIWASVYNVVAIPVAAGLFYHSLGWSIQPAVSALLMSASSIIVAVNAVMLTRSEKNFLTTTA